MQEISIIVSFTNRSNRTYIEVVLRNRSKDVVEIIVWKVQEGDEAIWQGVLEKVEYWLKISLQLFPPLLDEGWVFVSDQLFHWQAIFFNSTLYEFLV